jgi:hypothetical protein
MARYYKVPKHRNYGSHFYRNHSKFRPKSTPACRKVQAREERTGLPQKSKIFLRHQSTPALNFIALTTGVSHPSAANRVETNLMFLLVAISLCCPNKQPRALLVQIATLQEACSGETRSNVNSRCICHLLTTLCGTFSCVISAKYMQLRDQCVVANLPFSAVYMT